MVHARRNVVNSEFICSYPGTRHTLLGRMMNKNERIGLRVRADLKRALTQVAKLEGRSLAQVCEIFLSVGVATYKKRGSGYIKTALSNPHNRDGG